jgi:hypothetical protein
METKLGCSPCFCVLLKHGTEGQTLSKIHMRIAHIRDLSNKIKLYVMPGFLTFLRDSVKYILSG